MQPAWELDAFSWDPDTGLATLTYGREPGERTPDRRASNRATLDGERETMVVTKLQPACPGHAGWSADPHVRAFVDDGVAFPVRAI